MTWNSCIRSHLCRDFSYFSGGDAAESQRAFLSEYASQWLWRSLWHQAAGFFNSFVSPFYSMPFRSKTLPAANGILVRGGGSTSLTVDFTVSFSSTPWVWWCHPRSHSNLKVSCSIDPPNLMNITCIHGQTAGVEVVPVAPALVSQNIEGSNGANGAGKPEDSTRFLIQLCFVDRLEVWHHNFEPMVVEVNTSSFRS